MFDKYKLFLSCVVVKFCHKLHLSHVVSCLECWKTHEKHWHPITMCMRFRQDYEVLGVKYGCQMFSTNKYLQHAEIVSFN